MHPRFFKKGAFFQKKWQQGNYLSIIWFIFATMLHFMKTKFVTLNLDFLGFSASMLCAVHCAALPFVMTVGALNSLTWLDNALLESLFIVSSFGIATWSLLKSYWWHHRRLLAIGVVSIGFVLLATSRLVAEDWEPLLAVMGGVTIAVAHVINWRLHIACNMCRTH